MKSVKKIYYVPGLISAILIPLVFWHLGNRELQKPIPNVMDLGLPAKYNPKIPLEQQIGSWEGLRYWKYQKIIVQPNSAKINSKFYISELKKLQARNQNKTGIEFVLNNENSYGDFASVLNDFAIAKQEMYSLDLDKTGHLFAITNYKDPNLKVDSSLSDSSLSNDLITVIDYGSNASTVDLTGFNKWVFDNQNYMKYFISQLPKQAYYIILGYLILLNISIFSLIKRQF